MNDKTSEFITKAKEIHGDKYDYSKVEYINCDTKVCIICHEKDEFGEEHGEFWVTPYKHLKRSYGCSKCSGRYKYGVDTFIKRANLIHNFEYDYSKVEYKGTDTKVCVICKYHGEFMIKPSKHLSGQGCPKCRYIKSANGRRRTIDEVINKAISIHGDRYDYSMISEYKNDRTKYPIICNEHGVFYQTFNNHICFKQGCPICAKIKNIECRKYTTEEFITKAIEIHGDKYDYSKGEYNGTEEKICITCKKHGDFFQIPSNHLYGQGCPICRQSKLEHEIEVLLKEKNIIFEQQKTFEWLKYKRNMFLDFYLPDYNIAIECQGRQHFDVESFKGESYENIKERDSKKLELCNENGVKLLYYSNLGIEYPYEVIENKDVLIEKIMNG